MDDMRLSDARKLQNGIMISLGFAALAIIVLIGILYHNLKKARKLKQMTAEIDANSKRVAALNANLMEAIEDEEKSYKKKNEFIANISHEIRTPLNAIVGFSEILANNYSKDDESSEYTAIIRSNSDLMLDLVDQIIDNDLSKGGSYLHLEDVNVVNVAHNGLYSLSAIVKDGVKLEMKCEHEAITICTDRYRLQQLLTNLLGNAAAFTEKGKITLEVEKDDEYVTFNVIDTGCGIPKGQEKAIFGRFTKGSENSKGSGLGLYICSSICTQMHGKLYVDTTYNDGAKFVFKHPVDLRDELESKKGGAS
jgi:signal transduction histidine kinase